MTLALASPIALRIEPDGGAVGEITLKAGEERTFLLQVVEPGQKPGGCPTPAGTACSPWADVTSDAAKRRASARVGTVIPPAQSGLSRTILARMRRVAWRCC